MDKTKTTQRRFEARIERFVFLQQAECLPRFINGTYIFFKLQSRNGHLNVILSFKNSLIRRSRLCGAETFNPFCIFFLQRFQVCLCLRRKTPDEIYLAFYIW